MQRSLTAQGNVLAPNALAPNALAPNALEGKGKGRRQLTHTKLRAAPWRQGS